VCHKNGGRQNLTTTANKPRILLVDDEQDILHVLKQGLETSGYSVDSFGDPKKALSDFKPEYYHAILLDIRMPNVNGFELARAIWQQDEKAQICFLTAFEIYEQEAKMVFKDFKTHCFVRKPISAKVLAQHVQKHLLNT
jgi:DNA-binding response OmpR family regulator